MDAHRAYCSAVDRVVPVVLKAGAPPRDRVSLLDPADLVCLDYKVRCTGWCCPLFSVEDDTAPAREAGSGHTTPATGTLPATASAESPNHPPARPSTEPRAKSRWTRRT